MDNGHVNGARVKGADGGVQLITISEAPGTRKMSLDIDCLSYDVALALLGRATRELESRYRFMRAQELAQEAIQNARMAEIAAGVMNAKSQRA